MITEFGAADATLDKQISELEVSGSDFDSAIAILEKLESEDEHIDEDKLIFYVGEDTILANLPADYTAIKTCNGLDKQKLDDFLTNELYPNYNDQIKYLNL